MDAVSSGYPTADFRAGELTIPLLVTGFEARVNPTNGAWDLTLELDGKDNSAAFASLSSSVRKGPLWLDVGERAYEMTPRDDDRALLADFVAKCAI